ncbi:MAG: LemA family protein [Rhodospirillaceae bacterium]|nr:LemA family protein [Rhodospirillaceae bacterium]
MTTSIILVVLVLAVAAYAIGIYNKLVAQKNRVHEAWSDIDVQMKRRYDLIPNLVETVKGYAAHEQGTLEKVIAARNAAVADKGDPAHQAQTEGMLQGALKNLFALAESYPDLKANQNFMSLQAELSQIEDHIQKSRRYYNGSARDMNNLIEQFPSNLVAGRFAFEKATFFELEASQAAAREPVAVKF